MSNNIISKILIKGCKLSLIYNFINNCIMVHCDKDQYHIRTQISIEVLTQCQNECLDYTSAYLLREIEKFESHNT